MLREAIEGDLDGLLSLYTCLHDDSIPDKTEKLLSLWRRILRDEQHHIIVAEEEGRIVASCVCVIVLNLTRKQRPYAVIENVVTAPDRRGRGLATACLNYAREIARRENCYTMFLVICPSNAVFFGLEADTSKLITILMKISGIQRQSQPSYRQMIHRHHLPMRQRIKSHPVRCRRKRTPTLLLAYNRLWKILLVTLLPAKKYPWINQPLAYLPTLLPTHRAQRRNKLLTVIPALRNRWNRTEYPRSSQAPKMLRPRKGSNPTRNRIHLPMGIRDPINPHLEAGNLTSQITVPTHPNHMAQTNPLRVTQIQVPGDNLTLRPSLFQGWADFFSPTPFFLYNQPKTMVKAKNLQGSFQNQLLLFHHRAGNRAHSPWIIQSILKG